MGFYSNVIFPRMLEWALGPKVTADIRREVLTGVRGKVFEIGFGTGLNMPYYPAEVEELTTVDPNPGANKRAERRIAESPIQVKQLVLGGESLPMDDASFDHVVCTWTLCSIPEAEKALSEVKRVLRPGGTFHFVEHGLADNPKTQRWQKRLNPIWKVIGDGCHLDRNPRELIQDSGLTLAECRNYYLEDAPKFAGYLYQGVATRP